MLPMQMSFIPSNITRKLLCSRICSEHACKISNTRKKQINITKSKYIDLVPFIIGQRES